MGIVISIFRFIDKVLTTALQWAADLPGKLTLFVTTFVSTIISVFTFFTSNIGSVVQLVNTASSGVSSVTQVVQGSDYGSLLVYVTSLDVAARYVVSCGGVFLGAVSTVFLALFAYAMTCWVIPMAIMVVQKMISVFSAGFVKL